MRLFFALSCAVLCGCATTPADDDSTAADDDVADDDSATADDDTSGDDDDSTPDGCTQAPGPYTLTLAGGLGGDFVFTLDQCSALGADSWRISYSEPGGSLLRVTTGSLAAGQVFTTDLSISLVQGNTYSYAGRTQTGHIASVSVETYDEGGTPCGSWTTDPLEDNTQAQGPAVTLSPQPIPFRCP